MGKSGKLFKSLVAGVRVFKSPSKEQPVKDDRDHVKKSGKDKCFGSLGKSASRNREGIGAAAASPEAIEIKCVQVESEKLKDVLPVPAAESFAGERRANNKVLARSQDGVINGGGFTQLSPTGSKEHSTVSNQEYWAASKIQAAFRCYLAQRAFRALRALVRLQALARGRLVRRHASTSLRCLNALIRIQALARGRRVRHSELGQLVQKHLQQSKQSRKKPAEGWINSTSTAQQLHAKAQVKHDAATKRQRALVYAYSEQLNRRSQKPSSSSSGLDSPADKSHWAWVWLERWTAATPKGAPAAAINNCTPVTRNTQKAKSGVKGVKHSENSRKERKKWGEIAEGSVPILQRVDAILEENEETRVVVKKEEDMKSSLELERLGNPKENVQNAVSQPPTESPSSPSFLKEGISPAPTVSPSIPPPLKEGNAPTVREINLSDVQPSAVEISPDVLQPTFSNYATEDSSNGFLPIANGVNVASEAEKTESSVDIVTLCPLAPSQAPFSSGSFGTTNGLATEFSHVTSKSPMEELKENSLSVSLFSSQELCTPSETPSMHPSKTLNASGPSAGPHGSPTPDLTQNGSLNGVHQPQEVIQTSISVHYPDEAGHSINVVEGKHMTEETSSEDAAELSCEPSAAIEDAYLKNDDLNDFNHVDAYSETNGECDTSVVSVSVGARSAEVSSKNPSSSCLKTEQTECISPSVPSYMATTKSSKAKIRSLTSPKQKSDSPKQKLESPKLKSDSPKPKVDSPTQKPDSASKRRHSLSMLDGKVSPGTQKPTLHVRASSKGNFSLIKDLSTDNLSLANGESRRHGK